jgi:hypothetical protein
MLLEPIRAVISLDFYRRVAAQSWWRSLLYLVYLSLLLSLAFTVSLKIHAGPGIDATFEWLKKSAPSMTFANGKLTSSLTEPLVLRHPQMPQIGVLIDTNRAEPVSMQVLDDAKVQAYLTSNALYFQERPGQLRVYDFSKAADAKPVSIDAAFYESARQIFDRVLYPVVFAAGSLFVVLWTGLTTLVFALVGVLLNALSESGVGFGPMVRVALYAQTLPTAVQAAALLSGRTIPRWSILSLVITGVYIWLALARLKRDRAVQEA